MTPPFILLDRPVHVEHAAMRSPVESIVTRSNLARFFDVMASRRLTAVFQPILDLHVGDYYAFEGLIRGPEGSSLHSPATLFAMAREASVVTGFEHLCREIVLESFAALNMSPRLFINASIPCLTDTQYCTTGDLPLLDSLGLSTSQIVIEITENHLVTDFSALQETLGEYRKRGYEFAMDDLGEGFSNLRMWSEVRPEFVKIDRHFISDIATDPLKFQLVKAMQQIAETCGAELVAEGIETESEFKTVRDLGIRFAQGFMIARPEQRPSPHPSQQITELLSSGRIIVFPRQTNNSSGYVPISQLAHPLEPVTPDTDNDLVYARFEREPELLALPVVRDGIPVGMINRFSLIDRFARPYRRELYGKKSCRLMMDEHPVVVEGNVTAQDAARAIGSRDRQLFSEGFIITENKIYKGIGWSSELMGLITDLQIRSARYANPLTQLPGNVPISEHVERLLVAGTPFVACYADLDAFKPYNDVYGYRRGDEVIMLLSQILNELVDEEDDFLGHIGGDDFMVLFQSPDWEERCLEALHIFDSRVAHLFEPEHLVAGGFTAEDRRGQIVLHPLPSLSLGCVPVESEIFHSHHDVAAAVAEAKHQAKKITGSSLFVERRRAN